MPQTAVVRNMKDEITFVFIDVGDNVECYATDQEEADVWAGIAIQREAKDVDTMIATGLSYYSKEVEDHSISEIRKLTDGLFMGEAPPEAKKFSGSGEPVPMTKFPKRKS